MKWTAPVVGLSAATIVLAAVTGVSGCRSPESTNPATSSKSGSGKHTTAQLEIGNTINYGSFGTAAEVDCADGKSLNVGGSNNTLTVKGSCESVSVVGADNKITVDKIDKSLTITGIDNTVTYHNGQPKVDDHGSGNTVNNG